MPPACATRWRVRFRGCRGAAVAIVAMVPLATRGQDAPARADETAPRVDLPEVEIVAERPHGSLRAPASDTTVIEAGKFAGEVRSVA